MWVMLSGYIINAESIAPLESDAFVSEDVSRRVTPTGFKPVTF